ncbi:MAG: membrane protein insertion efficiency factor YidD [Elusimicrobia bacterium]|nr:membrane protein insertion efficiency factor YidD [Elusimicrobiota bacterium]
MLSAIRLYQLALRPLLPPRCRFYPSCSSFSLQAIEENGAWRGSLQALGRLLRCHPFHAGGYDPVAHHG